MAHANAADIKDQLAYFAVMALVAFATIIVCIYQAAAAGRLTSNYVLPAAWALYNAVGPALFFAAAFCKRTRTLEMAMYTLSMVGGVVCGRTMMYAFCVCKGCAGSVRWRSQRQWQLGIGACIDSCVAAAGVASHCRLVPHA